MVGRTRGRGLALLALVLVLALVAAACGDDGSVFGQGGDTSTTAADEGTTIPDETTTQDQQQTTTTQAQQQTTTTQAQQQQTTTTAAPTTTTTTTTLPAQTLQPFSTAYYSEFNLTSGFFDPWEYTDQNVKAGSLDPVDVDYLDPPNCYGYANDIPDFEVTYTAGSYDLLRFYFIADDNADDTVLIINGPNGQWFCNDDSFGTRHPSIDFAFPSSGVYDVWIGTYTAGELIDGRFFITELSGNHP